MVVVLLLLFCFLLPVDFFVGVTSDDVFSSWPYRSIGKAVRLDVLRSIEVVEEEFRLAAAVVVVVVVVVASCILALLRRRTAADDVESPSTGPMKNARVLACGAAAVGGGCFVLFVAAS